MATPPHKTDTPQHPGRRAQRRAAGKARGRATATQPKGGSHLGTALIVGAVAAVGAIATGALLALRGSSLADGARDFFQGHEEASPTESAHQPDGTDASASFSAGIADENTIPDHVTPVPG